MLYNNLINRGQSCSHYLRLGKNFHLGSLTVTRSKSKFKGKKQQNFEKIVYEHKNVPDPETTDFEPGEFLPRRLSYMPEGLPQNRGKKIKWWIQDKTPVTVNINPPEQPPEYVDKPNYPPIYEFSTGFMRQISEERENRINYYKSLEKMPTFDEKQFEITNLKSIPVILIDTISQLYDYLPLYKYITKTHVINDQLPSAYNESSMSDQNLDELVDKIKPHILNAIQNSIEFETADPYFEGAMHLRTLKTMSRLKKDEALIQNINNICMKRLMNENNQHLEDATVEYNSDVRSWWFGNQFRQSKNLKSFQIEKIDRINLSCQYGGYAPLNIRVDDPLVPIVDQDDNLVNNMVESFPTNPFKLGFLEKFKYVSNLPGFLPSLDDNQEAIQTAKRCDFPFLTFLNRELLNIRNDKNIDRFDDDDDVVLAMSLIHNFAYLNALAAVHGYTTYNELTYPFTNQTIITNGQYWSFFVYQMNTHTFHSDLPDNNKQNLCWSINNIKLYEEYIDGKFEGVNDEVLRYLVKVGILFIYLYYLKLFNRFFSF